MFFIIFFLKNINIVHFFSLGKEYKSLENEGGRYKVRVCCHFESHRYMFPMHSRPYRQQQTLAGAFK